jgi:hypothetical protein
MDTMWGCSRLEHRLLLSVCLSASWCTRGRTSPPSLQIPAVCALPVLGTKRPPSCPLFYINLLGGHNKNDNLLNDSHRLEDNTARPHAGCNPPRPSAHAAGRSQFPRTCLSVVSHAGGRGAPDQHTPPTRTAHPIPPPTTPARLPHHDAFVMDSGLFDVWTLDRMPAAFLHPWYLYSRRYSDQVLDHFRARARPAPCTSTFS